MKKKSKKIISILIGVILLIVIGFFIDAYTTYQSGPKIDFGRLILTDRHGAVIADKGKSGGYQVPYTGSLDTELVRSVITIEDQRFYGHHGIDLYGKLASVVENLEAGRVVRGGSTITEQYVKNIYFPGKDRTILQKIRESMLALVIESSTDKETILRGYLSTVYMGNGAYGISANPDTVANTLTRIKYPNITDTTLARAENYRNTIIKKLGITDAIFPFLEAKKSTINLYPIVTARVENELLKYCRGEGNALKKWTKNIPNDICKNSYTELKLTLDKELHDFALNSARGTIDRLLDKKVSNASIYITNPSSGTILAYIGTIVPSDQVDMIVRRRSVGSVLKPFVYLLALQHGADMEDYILDEKTPYASLEEGKYFVPENYNPKSYGPVKLREALGNSLNTATVRLTDSIGIPRVYDFLRQIGINLDRDAGHYGYGISIGTIETSLEDVVESYSLLTYLEDPNIWQIRQSLSDSRNRARTFGHSSILNTSLSLPVKTGTSTDFRDNWAVSYSQDAIIGVWVGNSDGSPMGDVSGVTGAGPIWHQIAEHMIARGLIKKDTTPAPPPLKQMPICLDVNCLRKELLYTKKSASPKSRPADNLYFREDFIGNMSEEEMMKWNILQN